MKLDSFEVYPLIQGSNKDVAVLIITVEQQKQTTVMQEEYCNY